MPSERYQQFLDLFERKESVAKNLDSFEIIRKIEEEVYTIIEDIFHPYEIVRTPMNKRFTPDGVIKMGERLIFYELITGRLDRYAASKIRNLIDYAQEELLSLSFPGQNYSIFIMCREYDDEAIQLLKAHSEDYRKRPLGITVITPGTLVAMHELAKSNVKSKQSALLRILDITGPVTKEDIQRAFEARSEKEGVADTPLGLLRATLEYDHTKAQFEGSFEDVWRSVNRFLAEVKPSHMIDAIASVTYKAEIDELISNAKGILLISSDGPFITIPKGKLTSEERIALILLGSYLGFRMGLLNDESLTTEEIAIMTGVPLSTVQVKTSQMIRNRLLAISDKGRRKITTIGVQHVQSNIIPKIRKNNDWDQS